MSLDRTHALPAPCECECRKSCKAKELELLQALDFELHVEPKVRPSLRVLGQELQFAFLVLVGGGGGELGGFRCVSMGSLFCCCWFP